jgi:hypothetical protein
MRFTGAAKRTAPSDSVAYKGYIIKKTFSGYAVSKDGHHISSPSSIEDAKRQIDQLA